MTPRLSRRLGLLTGLGAAFLLIAALQGHFNRVGRLQGPAALEPVAHEGAAALAFTRDGTELLSLDVGGEVRRWRLGAQRAVVESLRGRGIYESRSLFIDNAAGLCVGNAWGAAYALRLQPGFAAWRVPDLVWGAPSGSGRFVYGAERGGHMLAVYDAASRRLVSRRAAPDTGPLSLCVDLSPDGRWLAGCSGSPQGGVPCVVGTGGGPPVELDSRRWTGRPWLEFSPDGRRLALLPDGEPRLLRVLSTGDWRTVAQWDVGPGRRSLLRFSPDSRFIAVPVRRARRYVLGSLWLEERREDVQTLQVFEAATGRPLFDLADAAAVRGHRGAVVDCAWSPDGELAATLDDDGRIAWWDVRRRCFIRFTGE